VVFAGLAILATEFSWANRLLTYARGRYNSWTRWLSRQNWAIKLTVLVAAAVGLSVAPQRVVDGGRLGRARHLDLVAIAGGLIR
jgi:hypothetical protein